MKRAADDLDLLNSYIHHDGTKLNNRLSSDSAIEAMSRIVGYTARGKPIREYPEGFHPFRQRGPPTVEQLFEQFNDPDAKIGEAPWTKEFLSRLKDDTLLGRVKKAQDDFHSGMGSIIRMAPLPGEGPRTDFYVRYEKTVKPILEVLLERGSINQERFGFLMRWVRFDHPSH